MSNENKSPVGKKEISHRHSTGPYSADQGAEGGGWNFRLKEGIQVTVLCFEDIGGPGPQVQLP